MPDLNAFSLQVTGTPNAKTIIWNASSKFAVMDPIQFLRLMEYLDLVRSSLIDAQQQGSEFEPGRIFQPDAEGRVEVTIAVFPKPS